MKAQTIVKQIKQQLQKYGESNSVSKEIEEVIFCFSRNKWAIKDDSEFKVEIVDPNDTVFEVQNKWVYKLIDANSVILVDFVFKDKL